MDGRRHMFRWCTAVAAISAIIGGAAQADVMVTSFESSLFDATDASVTQAASTTGVTDGVQSVQLNLPATFWTAAAALYGHLGNLTSGGIAQLELDVTGTTSQGELWPILNTGAGWFQVFPAQQWQAGTITHMVFNIATEVAAITATPGWGANIEFGVNSYDTVQTIHIDNIRLTAVPEPASLSLAAAGALLMLRRRRA